MARQGVSGRLWPPARLALAAAAAITTIITSLPAFALLGGPKPGALSARTLKLPDGPASVRGLAEQPTFDVFTAQVNYSVPFTLPAGPASFGPSLSITYSGDLGNGPVGVGWSLSGIAIRRSVRLGVPSYTTADELELMGIGKSGRLVSIGSGEYRVEGDPTTTRVLKKDDGFEVTDADGTKYLLGYTGAAREADGDRVSGWLIQWIDHFGQRIEFRYTNDSGRVYLTDILWGPGQRFHTTLGYADRPDPTISFRTGYEVVMRKRLQTVTVSVSGQTLRKYTLGYDDAPTLALTRLHSVVETGTDGVMAMPELTFDYASADQARAVSVPGLDGWVLNARDTSLADVDGDGLADLLRLEMGNHVYRKNTGGFFQPQRTLSGAGMIDLGSGQLMDVDGDSRADLVHIVDDTWRAYKLDGEKWTFLEELSGTKTVALRDVDTVLADVNADGRTDVIQGETGGISVRLAGSGGLLPPVRVGRIDPWNVQVEPGNADVHFVDVNGDSVVDVVWLTDQWFKIYLGRGDGTFLPYKRAYYPWKNVPGADGVFKSSDIQFADLNRDGLTDIVLTNDANVLYFQGLADIGTFAPLRRLDRPEGVAIDSVVAIADANGNGSQDVVWSSTRGMWILDLAGGTSAGMLETIHNGLGATTTISYTYSAILAVEAEKAGQTWSSKLPTSIPVPTKIEVDTGGDSPPRITTYSVRNGFWDGIERRFGGFLETHSEVSASSGREVLIEEHSYLIGIGDDRELRGKEWRSESSNGLGQTFRVEKTDWVAFKVESFTSPLLRRAAKTDGYSLVEDGLTTPISIATHYELDSEGRTIVERHEGTGASGDEKIVRRRYDSDDARWIRDRVCDEKVLEWDDSTLRSEALTSYGSDTQKFAACSGQLGNGWVREVDVRLVYVPQLLPPQPPYVPNVADDTMAVDKTVVYDSVGNAIQTYESGVTRIIGYDADKLYATSETVHPATGQSLTWSMTWDLLKGQPSTLTDPNGDVTTVAYDPLSRLSSVALNGPSPYTTYTYDWTAPTPRTTTSLIDHSPSSDCSPAVRQTTTVVNGLGEPLYAATTLAANQWIVSKWKERDSRGKVVLEAEPFYASTSSPTARDGMARVQTFTYDALGRLSLQTLPNGARKSIAYVGLCQTVSTDELADVMSCADGLGRTAHTERTVSAVTEMVDAQYDAADRIGAMVLQKGMPNETAHLFFYDTWGHLRQAYDPDTGARSLFYDSTGVLRQHMNGELQSVYFDYDGAGRLIRRGDSQAPNASTDYIYNYDSDSAAMAAGCRVHSRLASVVEEQSGEVHFCYDAFGRQSGIARTITAAAGSRSASQQNTFSPSGLLLTEQFDDGFSTAYCYDAAGRATSVSSGGTTLWSAANAGDLDASGRVYHEQYGNGATETYDYDPLGLTKKVDLRSPVAGQMVDLFKIDVTRTAFGAPKTVNDNDGNLNSLNHSATYTYDGAARLTDATLGGSGDPGGQYAFTFRYDGLQNMIQRQVTQAGMPKDIGVLMGVYKYAERGYGPRQLTSVIP
jgi:YD repeat-containing protein